MIELLSIKVCSKTQGAPYYDAELDAEEIEWDKLEDRGTVVDSKSLEKATKADKKKEAKKEGKDPSPIAEEKLQKDEKDITEASSVLGLKEDNSIKQGYISDSLDALEEDPLPAKAVDIASLLDTYEAETRDINDKNVPKEKNLDNFASINEDGNTVCEP